MHEIADNTKFFAMKNKSLQELYKLPGKLLIILKQSGFKFFFVIPHALFLKIFTKLEFNEYHDFEFERQSKEYRKSYLNTKQKLKYLSLLNSFDKYYTLARNKYLTHIFLHDLNIPVARLIYYYDPHIYSQGPGYGNSKLVLAEAIKASGISEIVVKPAEGKWGKGVMVYSEMFQNNGKHYLRQWDGVDVAMDELLGNEPLLFEEKVEQTEQFRRINPNSLNTLRVMSSLYPDGEVDVFRVFIKFGRHDSCVSNRGDGENIAATVDINTGTLINPGHFKGFRNIQPVTEHPDSREQIEGIQIKEWKRLIDQVKDFHKRIGFLKVLGWDIAVTDKGALVIEMNDLFDNAGQIITGKGWREEIEKCYEKWKNVMDRSN